MTKCKGSHHDLDDFTTFDLTTFATLRLVNCKSSFYIDYYTSREVAKVMKSSKSWCGLRHFDINRQNLNVEGVEEETGGSAVAILATADRPPLN